jgi:hypothetical protein
MEARDFGEPLSRRFQTWKSRMNKKGEPSSHRVSFNGTRPLALTKRQAVSALGSSKLVARMLWASRHAGDRWLVIVRSGRDLLIDTESVETAYERLLNGEQPPLMPSECRAPGLRKNMARM